MYLPATSTTHLSSFSSPILNLQDSYVRAPFFGANYWGAQVKPVPGGGIPPLHNAVEIRLTFREGGTFDFHTVFTQIKEQLAHAYANAREQGQVNMADINLDQLPAYEAEGMAVPVQDGPRNTTRVVEDDASAGRSDQNLESQPDEAPPGYEEAQLQATSDSLENSMREEAERQ